MSSSNGQVGKAKQFQILRAHVFVYIMKYGAGVYVNGNLWKIPQNLEGVFESLASLYLNKLVITDYYGQLAALPTITEFPKKLNDLRALDPRVPEYKGPESHGMDPNHPMTPKPADPEKPHVRWIVWFDKMNHVVHCVERINGTQYQPVYDTAKEIAIRLGGIACFEYGADKFKSIDEIKAKYVLASNYTD